MGNTSTYAGAVTNDMARRPGFVKGDELAKDLGVLDSGQQSTHDKLVARDTQDLELAEVYAHNRQGGTIPAGVGH